MRCSIITPKPNLFILGAPKCGTSSVASWLATHKEICMCKVKEPNFFCSDLNIAKTIDENEYLRLFPAPKCNSARWLAEASTMYMHSRVAVPKIEEKYPDARYLVLLRNPSEQVVSWHKQLYFVDIENKASFETAWHYVQQRRQSNMIPKQCPEPLLLDYLWSGSLGDHLERLYVNVPKERVLVLLFDDIKNSPRKAYLKILEFLDLSDDQKSVFEILNEARSPRFRFVSWGLRFFSEVRRKYGIPGLVYGVRLAQFVRRWNAAAGDRYKKPSEEFMHEVRQAFAPQVEKLEQLTGRDLSMWRSK